jgi:hypothetical protein
MSPSGVDHPSAAEITAPLGISYWVMRCVKSGSWTITPAPPAPFAGSRSGEHPNSQGCESTHGWQQYTTLPSRTPRSTAIGQPHFGQVRFAISPSILQLFLEVGDPAPHRATSLRIR